MIINSTLNQLIIFDASADVPITSTILIKKKSEHIRKLPISEIRTTDISKFFPAVPCTSNYWGLIVR